MGSDLLTFGITIFWSENKVGDHDQVNGTNGGVPF